MLFFKAERSLERFVLKVNRFMTADKEIILGYKICTPNVR